MADERIVKIEVPLKDFWIATEATWDGGPLATVGLKKKQAAYFATQQRTALRFDLGKAAFIDDPPFDNIDEAKLLQLAEAIVDRLPADWHSIAP
jgi:hypothetical protein